MTLEIVLLLVIIAAAVVLFSLERLPADVIALGILLTLVLTDLLPAERAFAGFGSDTVVMIFGLLVLTASLRQTGVVDFAGRELLRLTGERPQRMLIVIMVTSAVLSALISNTATAALLVPVTLGLAKQTRARAAKLLMPMAFAAILSSSVTLVSTSTNLVISGLMTQYDMPPLGMLELSPVGLPIAVVGLLYMQFIGQRMIPDRGAEDDGDSEFALHPYLTELVVTPESPLIGKTLREAALGRDLDLTVLRVIRDDNRYLAPRAELTLAEGDQLLVKGLRDRILEAKDAVGLRIEGDVELSDPRLQSANMQLVEVILLPQSPLNQRSLKTLRFRQRYGLNVLGVNRRGKNIYRELSRTRLRTGDQLLIQGPRANIAALDEDNFHIIGPVEHQRPNRRRAPLAVGIFAGVLLLSALNVVSLPVAVTLGVAGVFATRCITPDEAYREVAWKAVIVIGCMLALGSAMEHTGTAEFLAVQLVQGLGTGAGPRWLLTLFFALTMALTQPMSNQAAAVLVLPIAVQTALRLGLNPRTFAAMIAVGASCSFITPLEPACLMVYGAGRYKFMDFVKVGSILTVVIYLIAIVMVPWIWPLGG